MAALITIDPGDKDMKSIMGKILGVAIIGGLGFAAYVFLLPFLISIVWGTIELIAGIVIGVILLMVVTNPKTWRFFKYLSEAI
ncbi:MAG: hypothetical protein ABIP51_02595, partial [Bacteroidia bacterium]